MPENKTTPIKKKAPEKTTINKKVEQKQPDKVAIFSSGNLFHPILGRISKGYSILDYSTAHEWMKISNKIREATPEEVAVAYGV
jgi:hypothetical protein